MPMTIETPAAIATNSFLEPATLTILDETYEIRPFVDSINGDGGKLAWYATVQKVGSDYPWDTGIGEEWQGLAVLRAVESILREVVPSE